MHINLDISDRTRTVIVSALALVFLATCGFSLLVTKSWINRPFPGFLVMRNNFVSVLWLPGWEGFERGLRFGDVVTAVNGAPVASGDELNRIVAGASPGAPMTYTVLRGNEEFNLTVPVSVFTRKDYISIFYFVMLLGALFFGSGLVVFHLRPNLPEGRAFLLLSGLAGMSFAASPEHCTTHINSIMLFTLPALGPAVLIMGLYYPRRNRWRRRALTVLLPSAALMIFLYNLYFDNPEIFRTIDMVHNVNMILTAGLGVFLMARSFRRVKDAAVRRKGMVILSSFAVGLAGGTGIVIGSTILGDMSIFWGIPFLSLIPLGFGYSIVVEDHFNLELFGLVKGSLALKLMAFLFAMGLLVAIPTTLFIYSENRRNLEHQILASGRQTNDLIINTTRYSMLKNDRKAIDMTVRSLKRVPEIELLRIYSKKGISFSTDKDDIGSEVDMDAPQCVVCHQVEPALEKLPDSKALEVFSEPDGSRFIAKVDPIYNSRSCGLTDCHPKPSEKKVLGVLETRLRLTAADEKMAASLNHIITFLVAGNVFVMAVTAAFIWFFVHRRVKRLEAATLAVGGGDLDHRVEIRGKDELGLLAESFNDMVVKVRHMVDLEASYNELKKLDLMKDNLLQMVSHDLRTPMTSILGYAYVLQDGVELLDKESQQEYLAIIIEEGERLTRLINDLLDLQRFEAGRMELEFEDLDIVELARESLKVFEGAARMKELDLDPSLPEGKIIVRGHHDRLRQVMSNLLSNAVKFTPEGGRVSVAAETIYDNGTPGKVRVSVSDTGKGIPKELQKEIFDKFQQAHKKSREATAGSGLGLALAREIIGYHGGTVGIESEPGKGSTFYFILGMMGREANDEKSADS